MSLDDFKEILSISKIEEKIFKIKELYHTNLIKNLSKEAYDLYLIRKSVCDQLLELLNDKDVNLEKLRSLILAKIEESKKQQSKAKNQPEINTIKMFIEEWEKFL